MAPDDSSYQEIGLAVSLVVAERGGVVLVPSREGGLLVIPPSVIDEDKLLDFLVHLGYSDEEMNRTLEVIRGSS